MKKQQNEALVLINGRAKKILNEGGKRTITKTVYILKPSFAVKKASKELREEGKIPVKKAASFVEIPEHDSKPVFTSGSLPGALEMVKKFYINPIGLYTIENLTKKGQKWYSVGRLKNFKKELFNMVIIFDKGRYKAYPIQESNKESIKRAKVGEWYLFTDPKDNTHKGLWNVTKVYEGSEGGYSVKIYFKHSGERFKSGLSTGALFPEKNFQKRLSDGTTKKITAERAKELMEAAKKEEEERIERQKKDKRNAEAKIRRQSEKVRKLNEVKTPGIFEPGKTYWHIWAGDSDLHSRYKVLSRTKSFGVIQEEGSTKQKRVKIYPARKSGDSEYMYPSGIYSMAPVMHANEIVRYGKDERIKIK